MKTRAKTKLSQEAIDKIVVAQANDDSAWTTPIRVRKAKATTVPFSADLVARAAFFARLHRKANVEAWLKRVIQERINLEEAAFAGVKRELRARSSETQP
jgi:transposase